MLDFLISAGINAGSDKFISPKELDCRNNYAIVYQTEEKEYPWGYPYPRVMMNMSGTMSISDTSSIPYLSISFVD